MIGRRVLLYLYTVYSPLRLETCLRAARDFLRRLCYKSGTGPMTAREIG